MFLSEASVPNIAVFVWGKGLIRFLLRGKVVFVISLCEILTCSLILLAAKCEGLLLCGLLFEIFIVAGFFLSVSLGGEIGLAVVGVPVQFLDFIITSLLLGNFKGTASLMMQVVEGLLRF